MQILEDLQAASGPARDLDVDVVRALYPDLGKCMPHCQGEEPIFWNDPFYKMPCPKVTADLTAALDLAGRLLAKLDRVHMNTYIGGEFHHAEIETEEGEFEGRNLPTPAMALCVALIQAVEARKP